MPPHLRRDSTLRGDYRQHARTASRRTRGIGKEAAAAKVGTWLGLDANACCASAGLVVVSGAGLRSTTRLDSRSPGLLCALEEGQVAQRGLTPSLRARRASPTRLTGARARFIPRGDAVTMTFVGARPDLLPLLQAEWRMRRRRFPRAVCSYPQRPE